MYKIEVNNINITKLFFELDIIYISPLLRFEQNGSTLHAAAGKVP